MAANDRREAIESKPEDNFVEMSTDLEKEGVLRENVDYSGAATKTSPEEIALVRKLDFRIMPTLWCMYFLNYVSSLSRAREPATLTTRS